MHNPVRPRRRRFLPVCVVALIVLALPVQALAQDSSLWRSLLLPGTGQAHQGRYTKAALFAGAAIVSATGLLVSAINYNREVDRFEAARDDYNSIVSSWNNGAVINAAATEATYAEMESAKDEADGWLKWRNGFTVALIATYTLNVVDVLMSKPHDSETALRYQIEPRRTGFLMTRSFRF